MNYEAMSDHEINMMVTSCAFNLEGWSVSESNISFYHCGIDGNGFYEQYVIDYCNNPADMWPIILENKIDIFFNSSDGDGAYKHIDNQTGIIESNKNPLRAAAIVYLKMMEK